MKRGQRALSTRRDGTTDSRSKIHARHHGSRSSGNSIRATNKRSSGSGGGGNNGSIVKILSL